MKFQYSRMELDLDCDGSDHNIEILKKLNSIGEESWLLVSPLAFCDLGNGKQRCSGIIVRTEPLVSTPEVQEAEVAGVV